MERTVPEAVAEAPRAPAAAGLRPPEDPEAALRGWISAAARGLDVEVDRVVQRTLSGLHASAAPRDRDELAIRNAAELIALEPDYSRLAARLLAGRMRAEVEGLGIGRFSEAVAVARRAGLLGERLVGFVEAHRERLDAAVDESADERFEYFGLRTLRDRYLLVDPESRALLETPQYFFLRVACALAREPEEALELYGLFSRLEYLPSSPTLFNAGTAHEQLSSCFLLDSPADDLRGIYDRYTEVALLSKFAGGIGLAWHRVRSRGSLIRSTNGHSTGVVPWLKTLDASVAAVNQGGRRKGACCVYLESWHADVEEFLELRDNTGDEARRTFNLNLANWVPDLFMRRVEEDGEWSLFDPKRVPELPDLWGEAFEAAYLRAEAAGLAERRVRARDLYGRMMRTLAETGNGWMTFKDTCNRRCNQTAEAGRTVHLSNLCTEIVEVTSAGEAAVCNLGSINLARHVDGDRFDFDKLGRSVRLAIRQLDRVIDLNFYPIPAAAESNRRWRPVGLGVMGLQDVFFQLGLPFDAPEARALSTRILERVYLEALTASCELAEAEGPHPAWPETRAARGELQPDLWGVAVEGAAWSELRARIGRSGLRNALLVAIAPTATIASIAGCSECVEPQVSNLLRRETLSGDFLQVNRYLVRALQALGLWSASLRDRLLLADGSVAGIQEIPEELRRIYRTAWELSMRPLIDMAAARGPFVDQSQSLNLFVESPDIPRLSSMYAYAWRAGLKTTYYLRSRPATRIAKATVSAPREECSLENPASCEACD